jgi:nicotinamide-nucleotide amidase
MQEISDVLVNEKAAELVAAFKEANLTFGTAESCTGGLIAKSVTDIAGASEIYLGSVVSYANSVKRKLLGVKKKTLDTLGAVSGRCALEMAQGARRALGVDIAVAVTGIAGPGGGTDEKPVGLVYIAVCHTDGHAAGKEYRFEGTRDEIRKQKAIAAMDWAIFGANYATGKKTSPPWVGQNKN